MTFEEKLSKLITEELDRRMELRLESDISKQKVKDAIKKHTWKDDYSPLIYVIPEELIKELKLED